MAFTFIPAPMAGIRLDLPPFAQGHAVNLVNCIVENGALVSRYLFRPLTNVTGTDVATMSGSVRDIHRLIAGETDKTLLVGNKVHTMVTQGGLSVGLLVSSTGATSSVSTNFLGRIAYTLFPGTGPQKYDGTTNSACTLTFSGLLSSIPLADFSGCFTFKSRVYWWSEKSSTWYYTAVNAIDGALEEFPTDRVSNTGGNVVCITSLTRDGGDGADDYLVIFLDTGETLIYQGSDPGSSNDWSLVGRFRTGAPINPRCVTRLNSDILYLTDTELRSLLAIIQRGVETQYPAFINAVNFHIRRCSKGEAFIYFHEPSNLMFLSPGLDDTILDNTQKRLLFVCNLENQTWSTFTFPLLGGTEPTIFRCAGSAKSTVRNLVREVPIFASNNTDAVVCVYGYEVAGGVGDDNNFDVPVKFEVTFPALKAPENPDVKIHELRIVAGVDRRTDNDEDYVSTWPIELHDGSALTLGRVDVKKQTRLLATDNTYREDAQTTIAPFNEWIALGDLQSDLGLYMSFQFSPKPYTYSTLGDDQRSDTSSARITIHGLDVRMDGTKEF